MVQLDGSIRWVGGRTFPISDEHGQVYRIAGIFDDVTERRQAEEALQRAHDQLEQRVAERTMELERLNRALRESQATLARRVDERTADLSDVNAKLARAMRLKDEFLASMSHELRTPLNAILGTYEVLHEQIYGPLTPRQTTALERIEASSRHLLALINDILDLSKIGAGKLELVVDDVPVATLCDASLQLTQQQAIQKELQLTVRYDPQVTTIRGDARRLKQMLVNLLTNAVKFTPAGGTVGLEVLGDIETGVVRFTVWDTGMGIEPKDQARMFEPFTQLDSGLARQFEGTGLGLALVANMVELHGGGIEVQSQVGGGSRFTLLLPWHEQSIDLIDSLQANNLQSETKYEHTACGSVPTSTMPLILVAEDNEQVIESVEDYLQSKHYRTVIARNGAEAVKRTQELHPDLIVMDVQMPGMSGLEATQRIRADAASATTPIIAVTALAMPGDRERCLEAGANLYLSKPASLGRLATEIESLLKS